MESKFNITIKRRQKVSLQKRSNHDPLNYEPVLNVFNLFLDDAGEKSYGYLDILNHCSVLDARSLNTYRRIEYLFGSESNEHLILSSLLGKNPERQIFFVCYLFTAVRFTYRFFMDILAENGTRGPRKYFESDKQRTLLLCILRLIQA